MSCYWAPHPAHTDLVNAVLRNIHADHYSNEADPNLDAEQQYSAERVALAARDLVRAVDALPADSRPIGWDQAPQAVEALPPSLAGARVRIVIEDTVESCDSGDLRATRGASVQGLEQPGAATVHVLDPGWRPGGVVHDGRDELVRVIRHGVHAWQRPDGVLTYDDEVRLSCLRVVRRAAEVAQ